MTIKITKKQIDEIFEQSEHHAEAIVNLYKYVYPDWDNIAKIDGFPRCGREVTEYIFEKCFQLKDNTGLLWMNNGFATSDLLGWEIDIEGVPCIKSGQAAR